MLRINHSRLTWQRRRAVRTQAEPRDEGAALSDHSEERGNHEPTTGESGRGDQDTGGGLSNE